MRRVTTIQVQESIDNQRLILDESWQEEFDRLFIYFIFGAIVLYTLYEISTLSFKSANEKFILITIFPAIITFGTYVIYRKFTEKKLSKIENAFDKTKNREILLDFAANSGYKIYHKSKYCCVLNKSSLGYNTTYVKSAVVIITNNAILFTVIQDKPKLNMPTLITHLLFEYGLKKLFNQQLTL
ncbi:hypothetical protein [Hymenobacter crusticola]|uniref:Uncharacterized protein n=1 Tax=Hymenobacter crusticola TaxID=1770526 RepID=A0A243W7F2_9BACT|nr:hypothetical protein [Hymenobacter crusticola]OUJ70880.1 hypothetical protein BXP70_23405 [Hymenobacter crusticola]